MSKTSEATATRLVMDTIQRVYGDDSQTVLDYRAASEIVSALRAAGWASLNEVAMLIEAAGGEITVSGATLASTRGRVVTAQEEFASGGKTFRVSVSR